MVRKISLILFVNRNSGVIIWDSGNPLAEEYIRACHLMQREDYHRGSRTRMDDYYNCFAYIHTGYVALLHTTQTILNDICNGY
jgi:hypothetical protein